MSPRKHVRFFAFEEERPNFRGPALKAESKPYAVTGIENYHALFAGAAGEKAIGEASHSYMYQPIAAGRIKEYDPRMKLVAILRNPAERAFSHYAQMIRDRRETINDFVRALEAEEKRVHENWWPDFHYVRIGLYHEQLERYYNLFEHHQIKVYLYDDLKSDPQSMTRDLFGFLGVDDGFDLETSLRYNASGIPRSKAIHAALQGMRKIKPLVERALPQGQTRRLMRLGSALHNRNLTKPKLSPEIRKQVTDRYFREDILKLQDLIKRDLSVWL
jgi:hypothetical protein